MALLNCYYWIERIGMRTLDITIAIAALAFAGTFLANSGFTNSGFSKSNVDVIEKSFQVADHIIEKP